MVAAVSLLQEEGREVMLVCYDQPLASEYAAFHDEPMVDYAWALLLEPCAQAMKGLRSRLRTLAAILGATVLPRHCRTGWMCFIFCCKPIAKAWSARMLRVSGSGERVHA